MFANLIERVPLTGVYKMRKVDDEPVQRLASAHRVGDQDSASAPTPHPHHSCPLYHRRRTRGAGILEGKEESNTADVGKLSCPLSHELVS
jgi:hypothetical protein